ncbi:MAG: DASS family sodium-coupled anion symporter [Verrucomicrobia bacterium]|nr:DASS family sodium-coupled anion symporter [Verrucomicrobiota bacterium]
MLYVSAQSNSSSVLKGSPVRKLSPYELGGLILGLLLFCMPFVVTFPGLSPAGHRIFSIFLLAIVLWVTEAIPLFATAAVIIFLEILMISDKSLLPQISGFSAPKFSVFYNALAHPVLMLFLGGFFLADGAAKFQLDRNLARVLLKPFGTSPKYIMLGLMLITAMFSMFMSNTATTATMMAVIIPVLATLPVQDRMRTGLALCIPIAANIGGIGTPVGTPPNAIALGALSKAGPQYSISFVKWMVMAIPCMVVILFFAWVLLTLMFRSGAKEIRPQIDSKFDKSLPAYVFYITFAATILLWLTEPLHHVKSTIVGFLPVVVLLSTRVFTTKELHAVQWHVLWLVAGGIALGTGVSASGLDAWMIGLISWGDMSPAMIAAILCLAALMMGSVISHSATANLLVPIGMTLAISLQMNPVKAAVFIAIGSSLAMPLPISTPPNAIAYSTGAVKTKDMAITGVIIGVFGWALFTLVAPHLWNLMGVHLGTVTP